jgi:hypothetical protein
MRIETWQLGNILSRAYELTPACSALPLSRCVCLTYLWLFTPLSLTLGRLPATQLPGTFGISAVPLFPTLRFERVSATFAEAPP